MLSRIASAAAGLLLATTAFTAPAFAKTFYWISHGSPADPVWTYFLARRRAVGDRHRQHRQHLVPQRRRRRAPGGRARRDRRQRRRHRHHQPRPGQPGRGRRRGQSRPTSRSSTSTPPTRPRRFDAYVGGDNVVFGRQLGAVPRRQRAGEVGRLRLDAGRGPRRHLRRAGGGRHQVGVRAARHHLGGHRRHARPGRGHHPDDRLPDRQHATRSRRSSASATSSPARSSASSTRSASRRATSPSSAGATRSTPPRRCSTGYVNAAQWQDPQATSYVAPVARGDGGERHPAPASTSSPARSTRRTQAQLYDDILSGK